MGCVTFITTRETKTIGSSLQNLERKKKGKENQKKANDRNIKWQKNKCLNPY